MTTASKTTLLSSPLQGFTDFRFRNALQHYFGGIDTYYAPYIRLNGKLKIKSSYQRDLDPAHNTTLEVIPQVMTNDADVMIAGGAEAAISEIGIAGFNACKALSTKRADAPETASRPYDEDRDGFVMGEGSGIVVLEDYDHARARGAKIYAEVLGYGLSGDAYHITAPSEDGEGGERAMRAALAKAGVEPSAVDYINAHGTSTMADVIELAAVERMMGPAAAQLTMSSTKSSTGHLLGAAGAIEAIFTILAIHDQVAPPTINLDNPAVDTPVDLAANQKRERKIDFALSNSFGFGGTNACLALGRVE